MITIIVAYDNIRAIGSHNDIPWHLTDDLRRFKAITTGHTVIMGRNTWLSLPFRPLKNRRNIVISSTMPHTEGCEVVRTIDEALELIAPNEEAFIMGGASIYRQTIERADRILLTHVFATHAEADTFFPDFDISQWEETDQSERFHDDSANLDFQYIELTRKTIQNAE